MPLSTTNYIKMNLKRMVVVSISIGLAMLFIYILSITLRTVERSEAWIYLNPTQHYSVLVDRSKAGMSDDLIRQILEHPSTDRAIGIKGVETYYTHVMAGTVGVGIWMLKEDELPILIDKLGLTLKEGRLPAAGADELVLHELLLQNKGLQLGDAIGNSVNSSETIPGSYEIVGVLTGDSIVGFGVLDAEEEEQALLKHMMMLFHKEGERDASNQFIRDFLPKDVDVITHQRMSELSKENNRSLYSALNMTLIVAIVVLSITIANSTYLHFFERKKEYALLRAIGYSRAWTFSKAGKEIAITSLLGLFFGFCFTSVSLFFFTRFVLEKVGAPYQWIDVRALFNSLTIVVVAFIVCLIPVWMFLGKIDVISTIEGGETDV